MKGYWSAPEPTVTRRHFFPKRESGETKSLCGNFTSHVPYRERCEPFNDCKKCTDLYLMLSPKAWYRKSSTPPRHVMAQRWEEPGSETDDKTRERLWRMHMVGECGVFQWATEELHVDFMGTAAQGTNATCHLFEAFDGWRYFYHISYWETRGAKPDYSHGSRDLNNWACGVGIDKLPYPSREAALNHFFDRARCYLSGDQSHTPKPELREAMLACLDRQHPLSLVSCQLID